MMRTAVRLHRLRIDDTGEYQPHQRRASRSAPQWRSVILPAPRFVYWPWTSQGFSKPHARNSKLSVGEAIRMRGLLFATHVAATSDSRHVNIPQVTRSVNPIR